MSDVSLPPSFVLTLMLDDSSFRRLQDWRTRYFPPHRNYIPVHLTLLHTVSMEQVDRLRSARPQLERLAPIVLQYSAPRFLGSGVAIDVDSSDLHALRARLLDAMAGSLTRQDQQPFRAHVTIQNKVPALEAKTLHQSLSASFEPWYGEGRGLMIWKYLGGPWVLETTLELLGGSA